MADIQNSAPMSYTLAICTFNRVRSLEQTLASLAQLNVHGLEIELIVVDNNSSDGTESLVEEFARTAPMEVRYFLEKGQGLSIARNRAVREARGEWLVFTDDDVTADANFLIALDATIRRTDARCVGGRILLRYPGERPSWLTDHTDYIYGRVDLGDTDVPFSEPYVPLGPSLAIRMDMFGRYGLFNENLGLAGTTQQVRRGEEVELVQRLIRGNELVMYSAGSIVYHRVDPLRLTQSWYLERFAASGRERARTVDPNPLEWAGYLARYMSAKVVERIGAVLGAEGLAFYGRCKAMYFRSVSKKGGQ